MIYKLLLGAFVALAVALTGATNANAASPYDNTIDQITGLYVGTPPVGGDDMYEIPLDWYGFLLETCTQYEQPQHVQDFINVVNDNVHGQWYIVQNMFGNQYPNDPWQVAFFYNTNMNASYHFDTVAQGQPWEQKMLYSTDMLPKPDNTDYGVIYIGKNPGANPHCYSEKNGQTYQNIAALNSDGYAQTRPFASGNVNVVYPPDYEGQTYPDTAIEPPQPPSDYTPWITVFTYKAFQATFSDRNFFTFDPNQWVCPDEFAPMLHYEVYNRTQDEIKIIDGQGTASGEFYLPLEKKNSRQTYRIVAWYSCPQTDMTFEHSSYRDFEINSGGLLIDAHGWEACMTDSFPWFNMEACLSAYDQTLQMLSFQILNPNNENLQSAISSSDPNGCHTLGKLGSWINAEGTLVCANVSQDIRNTVTPFVTFVLGGAVFYFITRSRSTVI